MADLEIGVDATAARHIDSGANKIKPKNTTFDCLDELTQIVVQNLSLPQELARLGEHVSTSAYTMG